MERSTADSRLNAAMNGFGAGRRREGPDSPTKRTRALPLPRVFRVLALLPGLLVAALCVAHSSSVSHSRVTVSGNKVNYEIRFSAHDIATAIGLEANAAQRPTTRDFRPRRDKVLKYVQRRLLLRASGDKCKSVRSAVTYSGLPETLTATLGYACPSGARRLTIDYRLFFDQDPNHTAMGVIRHESRQERFLFDRGLHRTEFEL